MDNQEQSESTDSNLFLRKKEEKKEEREDLSVCVNPKGPHDGEGIASRNMGVPIPQTEAWTVVIKEYRQLAAQESSSIAHVMRAALLEYYGRHKRGNPAIRLDHWITGEPLSIAAQEKLRRDYLPPKTHLFPCQQCNGKGCESCGGRGEYYHITKGETIHG